LESCIVKRIGKVAMICMNYLQIFHSKFQGHRRLPKDDQRDLGIGLIPRIFKSFLDLLLWVPLYNQLGGE